MIEIYAFEIGNSTLTFENIKSDYGLQFKGMNDSGLISWDIATSKTPYQNGLQVNNRTANAREITIEFEFENADVTTAQTNFENAIAKALNGQTLTIKKTVGSFVKRIDGIVQSAGVENIYTDNGAKPIYQLTLLSDSYWRGVAQTVNGSIIQASGPIFNIVVNTTLNCPISPDMLKIEFNIEQCSVESYKTIIIGTGSGAMFKINYPFITVPKTNLTKQTLEIIVGKVNQLNIVNYNGTMVASTDNIIQQITSGAFPTLDDVTSAFLRLGIEGDQSEIIAPDKAVSMKLTYIPLYIR